VKTRVGNFRQKNYSAEDGIDGITGLFRRNSGYSAEQETLGIPFRTTPQRRKMFESLYRETKIEANTWNSVPNHSTERETNSEFRSVEQNSSNLRLLLIANLSEFRFEECLGRKHAVNTVSWSRIFCKTNFLCHSVPFRASELTLP
jgi:hypothetical protein